MLGKVGQIGKVHHAHRCFQPTKKDCHVTTGVEALRQGQSCLCWVSKCFLCLAEDVIRLSGAARAKLGPIRSEKGLRSHLRAALEVDGLLRLFQRFVRFTRLQVRFCYAAQGLRGGRHVVWCGQAIGN